MMNDGINRNCPGRFQPVGLFSIYAIIGCVLACIAVAQANRTQTSPLPDQVIVDPEHPQWFKRQGRRGCALSQTSCERDRAHRGEDDYEA
jgi:hypothetical protein